MLVKEDMRIQAGERHRGNQPTRKTFRRLAEDTVGKGLTPRRANVCQGPDTARTCFILVPDVLASEQTAQPLSVGDNCTEVAHEPFLPQH